jgi:hypothetical protein
VARLIVKGELGAHCACAFEGGRSPRAIAVYHILQDELPYHDLGADYFTRRANPDRIAKRLVAQLERLGHTVTLHTSTTKDPIAA